MEGKLKCKLACILEFELACIQEFKLECILECKMACMLECKLDFNGNWKHRIFQCYLELNAIYKLTVEQTVQPPPSANRLSGQRVHPAGAAAKQQPDSPRP